MQNDPSFQCRIVCTALANCSCFKKEMNQEKCFTEPSSHAKSVLYVIVMPQSTLCAPACVLSGLCITHKWGACPVVCDDLSSTFSNTIFGGKSTFSRDIFTLYGLRNCFCQLWPVRSFTSRKTGNYNINFSVFLGSSFNVYMFLPYP